MTKMKHIDTIATSSAARRAVDLADATEPIKAPARRGIRRVLGSASSHVRHNVGAATIATSSAARRAVDLADATEPIKAPARRGIRRVLGSASSHVRHNVGAAAEATRNAGLDPEIAHIGALDPADAMDLLGCGPRGLTEQQADRIRSVHGANIIAPEHHDPLSARLSRAFLTPFTLILLALAAISLYTNVYLAAPGEASTWPHPARRTPPPPSSSA